MELLLHYLWKNKFFPQQNQKTTNGTPIEIIDVGQPNYNAGPDFFNSKVKIDGCTWAGNIEIHNRSSEWRKHGHHTDSRYNSVILHVVLVADVEVSNALGNTIPQFVLPLANLLERKADELLSKSRLPKCYASLPSLKKIDLLAWLDALLIERLEERAVILYEWLVAVNFRWSDVLFISLSRSFGLGVNSFCFEQWALSLPFHALDKHRDNLFQLEAIFFGMAGVFEQKDLVLDAYARALEKEYNFLSYKFGLTCCKGLDWKMFKIRPQAFPYLKIAQLAYIYSHLPLLVSSFLTVKDERSLALLLKVGTSSYWENHFRFAAETKRKKVGIGKKIISLVFINTIVPFVYLYGKNRPHSEFCEQAVGLLEKVKAEDNYITRAWRSSGVILESAADSQAILQLDKRYCSAKKCLYCRIGFIHLKGACLSAKK